MKTFFAVLMIVSCFAIFVGAKKSAVYSPAAKIAADTIKPLLAGEGTIAHNPGGDELLELPMAQAKIAAYPPDLLSTLSDKDSIVIDFETQGCFHAAASKLTITKQGSQLIARLYEQRETPFFEEEKQASGRQALPRLLSVTMTKQHIRQVEQFGKQLALIKDGMCTTRDSYRVKSKNWNVAAIDGSCDWHGFYTLSTALFGKKIAH